MLPDKNLIIRSDTYIILTILNVYGNLETNRSLCVIRDYPSL